MQQYVSSETCELQSFRGLRPLASHLAAPRTPAFGSSTSLEKNPPTFRPAYGPAKLSIRSIESGFYIMVNLLSTCTPSYDDLLAPMCRSTWMNSRGLLFRIKQRYVTHGIESAMLKVDNRDVYYIYKYYL